MKIESPTLEEPAAPTAQWHDAGPVGNQWQCRGTSRSASAQIGYKTMR